MPRRHGPQPERRPFLIIATGAAHGAGGGLSKCCTTHPGQECWTQTEHPQFEVACPWCQGKADDCAFCVDAATGKASGRIQFFRCRSTHYGPEHMDVVRSFGLLEKGVLPAAGGWTDQSATWVDAVGIVECEIEEYRKRAAEEARS